MKKERGLLSGRPSLHHVQQLTHTHTSETERRLTNLRWHPGRLSWWRHSRRSCCVEEYRQTLCQSVSPCDAPLCVQSHHTQTHEYVLLLLLLLLQPFKGLFSRTIWKSRYQKGKTCLDLNGARDGISWTMCKQSAPRSRHITKPTPHHSIFTGQMLFQAPNQQCQSTEDKSWRRRQIKNVPPSLLCCCWPNVKGRTACAVAQRRGQRGYSVRTAWTHCRVPETRCTFG